MNLNGPVHSIWGRRREGPSPAKRSHFMAALVLLLLSAACACRGATVAAPITRYVQRTPPSPRTRARRSMDVGTPVAAPVALDTTVVERMVGQRLRTVEANLLRDALTAAGQDAQIDSKPTRDLLGAITSLLLGLSDARGRSQNLAASLLRSGLSFTLAELSIRDEARFHRAELDPATYLNPAASRCGPATGGRQARVIFLADLAYEGLAASSFLSPLGFPLASGEVTGVSEHCVAYVHRIRDLMNGLAGLRDAGGTTPLAAAVPTPTIAVPDAIHEVSSACVRPTGEAASDASTTLLAARERATRPGDDLVQLNRDLRVFDLQRIELDAERAWQASCRHSILNLISATYPALAGAREAAPPEPPSGAPPPAAADSGATGLAALLAGVTDAAAPAAQASLPIRELWSVVQSIVGGDATAVRRGDVVVLIQWIRHAVGSALQAHQSERGVKVLLSFLEQLPHAIREDRSQTPERVTIYLDPAVLVSALTASFSNTDRGWYIRATVGMGYGILSGLPSNQGALQPVFYEELGFGRRCRNFFNSFGPGDCEPSSRLLLGWHVVSSGLLYEVTSQTGVEHRVFVGGGFDANLYRLLDVSVSAGALIPTQGEGDPHFGLFFGFQLPLADYIQEITSSSETTSQSTTGTR